jgi:hypothetical protein
MESPSRSESQSNGTPPALPGRKGVAFPEPVAIPLADGTDWRASTEQLAEWQGLYPAVDVAQAFRSMRGWCLAKPMNRKTAREVESFIVNWLNGDQRRGTGPAARGNGAAGGHRSASDERYKRANERPS